MSDFRRLTTTMLASPQITVADVAEAKAQGVTLIVNNRPEGESDDQTPGAQIEAAANQELASGESFRGRRVRLRRRGLLRAGRCEEERDGETPHHGDDPQSKRYEKSAQISPIDWPRK